MLVAFTYYGGYSSFLTTGLALYGNAALSEDEFVVKIQSVLKSLNATKKSIPARYVLDFSHPKMSVNRTSASLYLMLFQVRRPTPNALCRETEAWLNLACVIIFRQLSSVSDQFFYTKSKRSYMHAQ